MSKVFDAPIDPNIGWEILKLLDRSMFNIGVIGFDVDGNVLVKLFSLAMEELQASGVIVVVDDGGGDVRLDVDGYE